MTETFKNDRNTEEMMRKRVFTVVIEQDEAGNYLADVPLLKGCHTQARTLEELMRRAKEAITLCVEDEKKIPKTKFVGVQQLEIAA